MDEQGGEREHERDRERQGGRDRERDRWHIEVDRDVCIGSGMCAAAAPADFRLDGGRQSHPVSPDRVPSETVLAAAEGCPVEAIAIALVETGEQVFPPED